MPDPTALSLIAKGLDRVEGKVDDVLTALSSKAEKADLEQLRADHHARLSLLEDAQKLMLPRFVKTAGAVLTVVAAVTLAVVALAQLF